MSELNEEPIGLIFRLTAPFKERGTKSPEIKFLYVEHEVEKFDQIWEKTKNADIVLLENVGTDPEYEKLLINIVKLARTNRDERIATMLPLIDNDKLIYRFAGKAIKEGKEIHLIDIPEGGSGEEEFEASKKLSEKSIALFHDGEIEKSFEKFCESIGLYAESNGKREDYTIEQIEELVEKNKDKWKGKKIVVIQGAIHTPVYHGFRKRHKKHRVRREFVRMPYSYSVVSELERRKRFFPQKPLHQTEYLRAYLSNILLFTELYNGRGYSDDKAFGLSSKIARRLTEEEINDYWSRILKEEKQAKTTSNGKVDQKDDHLLNFLVSLRKEIVDKHFHA